MSRPDSESRSWILPAWSKDPGYDFLTPTPGRKPPIGTLRRRLQTPFAILAVLAIAIAGWIIGREIREWREDARSLPELDAHAPFHSDFDLTEATVPVKEIFGGGPPKDGIPALTEPRLLQADEARYLRPEDRVIGVRYGDEARAYPLRILNYHEIVNDRIENTEFAVTYCPLCDSSAVFDRAQGDDLLELGVSGLLYNSNVLMHDRGQPGKESLWSQLQTAAISGPRVGRHLDALPLEVTTWEDWRGRNPQTLVLSDETGHDRDYSQSPYDGYFRSPNLMFPVDPVDRRLLVKSFVLAVWTDAAARAYPVSAFSASKENREVAEELGGKKFRIVWNPESKSLRIVEADGGLRWMYSFWFAWAAFNPTTEIYSVERRQPR